MFNIFILLITIFKKKAIKVQTVYALSKYLYHVIVKFFEIIIKKKNVISLLNLANLIAHNLNLYNNFC